MYHSLLLALCNIYLFSGIGLQIFHCLPVLVNVNVPQLLISIWRPLEVLCWMPEGSGGIVWFLRGMEHLAVPLAVCLGLLPTSLKTCHGFTTSFVTEPWSAFENYFSAVSDREVKKKKKWKCYIKKYLSRKGQVGEAQRGKKHDRRSFVIWLSLTYMRCIWHTDVLTS